MAQLVSGFLFGLALGLIGTQTGMPMWGAILSALLLYAGVVLLVERRRHD